MTTWWFPGFLSLPDDPPPVDAHRFSLPLLLRKDVASALDVIRSAIGPEDVAIGYSMGGRLLLAAAASGLKARALVFLSTSPGIDDPDERARRMRRDEERAALLQNDVKAFVDAWRKEPVFAHANKSAAWRAQQRRRKTLSQDDAGAWAHVLRIMSPGAVPSQWDHLSALPSPSLWICGALDTPYVRTTERAAAAAPDARCEIVEGVGHALPLEAPEEVRKLLHRFLHAKGSPP